MKIQGVWVDGLGLDDLEGLEQWDLGQMSIDSLFVFIFFHLLINEDKCNTY